MLRQEGNARCWAWLMLESVRYADRPVEDIFKELVDGLANTLRQFIDGVQPYSRSLQPDDISQHWSEKSRQRFDTSRQERETSRQWLANSRQLFETA